MGLLGLTLVPQTHASLFGTSNRVEIVANEQGNRMTPSCVAFCGTERLIGDNAKKQLSLNPDNTVFDTKRLIGREFADPIVQSDMKHWPFKVVGNAQGKPTIEVQFNGATKSFSPEEISAMVLKKMKGIAEAYLDAKVTKVVVTVPAYFNTTQRQATKDAAAIAGLEVLRIISEPTAAAIAYGLGIKNGSSGGERNVMIFDLGGGTFDVSLVSVEDDVFEVKATNGNTHLGGADFDNLLVNHFVGQFKLKNNGTDISGNKRATRRLAIACERAKLTLSSATQATIEIDALFDGIDFQSTLTRTKFEELCADLFQSTLGPVKRVLQDAKMDKRAVHDVVLVGGSTRIPKVQQLLSDFFGGKALNKSINPDEAVAYGAAVQAFILAGGLSKQTDDLLLLDVTPLSLGIETKGGAMSTVLNRNTTIPTTKSVVYTTPDDNMTVLRFSVFQGDRAMIADCYELGHFHLNDIPAAPAGMPKIEVTFHLDANGILNVLAREKASGKMNHIVIANGKGLSKLEIERMILDAAKFADLDKPKRDRVDAINGLECYAYSMRNSVADPDVGGKLDDADKSTVNNAVNDVLSWVRGHQDESQAEFDRRKKELSDLCTPILAKTYQQPMGAPVKPQAPSSSGPKIEEVD
jgi:heat shock 70kDa protein 1/2/6/8